VYDQIAQVSQSGTTALIRGESGTGKELVANAIHYNSLRSGRPFIKVNCAALPETVIESELFGHEKGAFTGAVSQRKGRFELADGGTIFLDEIGDLSPATQIKLLRVLQEKELERVGGATTVKADVRVIAATNRNLEELIEDGRFRQDLYYRLNVFPIHVPPLRERGTDVLLLANYFADRFSRDNHKEIKRISTPAIDMLMSYHWPGNVRELENCVERAVLLSNDDVIHGHHLPPTLQTAEASGTVHKGTLPDTLDAVERELIVEALKNSRGNKAKAARTLGISERLMGLRVNKHGIDPRRFRTKS
jgi:Nif-specific regulatory protein